MAVMDFIRSQEIELKKPINQVDWEKIYNLALETDDFRFVSDIGSLTNFFLSCNIHPEVYLEELPEFFLAFTDITNFTIPSNIHKIGARAFYNCENLSSIVIPTTVTDIADRAFLKSGINGINLPPGIKEIGSFTFSLCPNLKYITIPQSVKVIGANAFRGSGLQEVILEDGIEIIGESAFQDCLSLHNITLSNTLQRINNRAFYNCDKLKEIVIPRSVTHFGIHIFNDSVQVIHYRGSEEDWNNIHKSMYWGANLSSFVTTIDYDYKGI